MPEAARALGELARSVSQLPPLPAAVLAVAQALQRDELSAARCIGLIEGDPALAARTLRLANSAFYGAPGRVGSIVDAVRMLGLRTISSVLTAASMHALVPIPSCPGFEFARYWRHAIATALAARALAEAVMQDADQAFVAGLMHDIGQLVLMAQRPRQAAAALALASSTACGAAHAEQKVFGFTHARVGALVAAHWRLPPAIVQALADHHASAGATAATAPLTELVRVADTLAAVVEDAAQDATSEPAAALVLLARERLGLDAEAVARIAAEVLTGTREMCDVLAQA